MQQEKNEKYEVHVQIEYLWGTVWLHVSTNTLEKRYLKTVCLQMTALDKFLEFERAALAVYWFFFFKYLPSPFALHFIALIISNFSPPHFTCYLWVQLFTYLYIKVKTQNTPVQLRPKILLSEI